MPGIDVDEGKGKMAFAGQGGGVGNRGPIAGTPVEKIGSLEDFLKIYSSVKQVQRLIDFKTNYLVKDGYFISSRDEEGKAKVEEYFENIRVIEVIKTWDKNARIYGQGFLEVTTNWLKPIDPRDLVTVIDEEGIGEIQGYVQEIGQTEADYPTFQPEEILTLLNNPIDHLRGVSDLLAVEDIVNLNLSTLRALNATIDRNAYRRNHYTIGSEDAKVSPETDKFKDAKAVIDNLEPGQDLITTHEVSHTAIDSGSMSIEYKNYLDSLTQEICMELGVPYDFFYGTTSGETIDARRKIFEEAEIMTRRRQIEDVINQDLIPKLVSVDPENPIRFRFGSINTEMAFLKAKMELVELQTGSSTPNEVREEHGKDSIEGGDTIPQAQQQQVPVSSRDETSQRSIGGNLSGSRPAGEDSE